MAVTIIDVAKEANVSKSTVSLVINNSPRVKLETKYRVLEAIEKLGYVANINARNLTTNKTNILGIITMVEDRKSKHYEFTAETEVFGYDVSIGIPNGLKGTDYGLLTERFYYDDSGKDVPIIIKSNRVDGVFIVGGLFQDPFIRAIKERDIPIVVVGRTYHGVDCVVADVEMGAYISAKHLIETGHKSIYYINCPVKFSSNHDRKVGYERAINEHCDVLDEYGIVNTEHNTGEGGYEAIQQLWESGVCPEGVVAANDSIALGIMRYFYEKNIRIPDDVSIVSYEDSVLSGYSAPALTTVNFDKELMGEEACRILLNRIQRPKSKYVSLTLPVSLTIRNSVKRRRH